MIFNSPEFHALNGVEPTTYGCLTGVWKDGVFENGYSAPFAGFDIPDDTPPWRVQEMVSEAFGLIYRENQSFGIRIKLPPPVYTPTWHAQVKALLDLGFRVERSEINQHIDLKHYEFSRSAVRAESDMSFVAGGPEFREAKVRFEWLAGYDILHNNRERKGRALKLSFDYVMRAWKELGARMFLFGDVCAALVYLIAPGKKLVVYWGDDEHTYPVSPMPAFARGLIEEMSLYEGAILDLGISTDPGLMQFKRSVGAKEGLRLDMVRGL